MPKIAEITNPTGNAYMPGSCITDLFTHRVMESGSYQLDSDETGKSSRLTTQKRPDYTRDIFPYRLLAETTGADLYECRELLIIVGTEVASHNSITNTSFLINEAVQIRKEPSKPLPIHSSHELSRSRRKQEITDLANRLRQSSGLDVESLAQIFKVSRVTYHRWLRGLPVSKRHHDYILEILPLIEEAAQRLGSPEAVSTWLLTPISSGGKKPIEYLAEKHYDLFRGFLLHQRTGREQFRPLKPSRRVFKPRNREEIEDVREQLRPHTWYDEDNDLNSSND
jgi:transcriptional regulator with XRE-family HTH domain